MKIIINKLKIYLFFFLKKTHVLLIGVAKDISLLSLEDTDSILKPNVRITFDYLILLVAATVVSSLGLLMNSTPIIVGGMIISPLMWPILGTSYALWSSQRMFLWKSLRLLAYSIFFILFTSSIITFLAPIKILNEEILNRTTPTLLDLVVALASGGVAMLALTNKRVSSSLAGVAIATSLLPPICVSGIGIAMLNFSVFWGGFLLFITNTIAIIAIGILYLIITSILKYRTLPSIDRRGTIIILTLVLLLFFPLRQALRQYSWKLNSFQKSRTVILNELKIINPSIDLTSIEVLNQRNNQLNIVSVNIDIVMPQETILSFDDKEYIRKRLEEALKNPVDLSVRIQETFSVLSPNEMHNRTLQQMLAQTFKNELLKFNSSIIINTLKIEEDKSKDTWNVSAVLTIDPSNPLSENDRAALELRISNISNKNIQLSLDLIPRIKLRSDQEGAASVIQKEISSLLTEKFPNTELVSINIGTEATTSASPSAILTVQIRRPLDIYPAPLLIEAITQKVSPLIKGVFKIRLRIIPIEELSTED